MGISTCVNASKNASVIEDFPSMSDVTVDDAIRDKVGLLLMMYRHHCQNIVETVVETNFEKVDGIMDYFWRHIPANLENILDSAPVINLLCLCDVILCQTLLAILVPRPSECMPDNLKIGLKFFAEDLVQATANSGLKYSRTLQQTRKHVAEMFANNLKRLVTISHLAEAVDTALYNTDNRKEMLRDWKKLDIDVLLGDSCLASCNHVVVTALRRYCNEFEKMLRQGTNVDFFLDWINNIYEQLVGMRAGCLQEDIFEKQNSSFVFGWTHFSKTLVRELTINNACTLGSFHLIVTLIQDYLFYLLHEKDLDEMENKLTRAIKTGSEETWPIWSKSKSDMISASSNEEEDLSKVLETSLLEELEGEELLQIELMTDCFKQSQHECAQLSTEDLVLHSNETSNNEQFIHTPVKFDSRKSAPPPLHPRSLLMSPQSGSTTKLKKEFDKGNSNADEAFRRSDADKLSEYKSKEERNTKKGQHQIVKDEHNNSIGISPKLYHSNTKVSPANTCTSPHQLDFMKYLSQSQTKDDVPQNIFRQNTNKLYKTLDVTEHTSSADKAADISLFNKKTRSNTLASHSREDLTKDEKVIPKTNGTSGKQEQKLSTSSRGQSRGQISLLKSRHQSSTNTGVQSDSSLQKNGCENADGPQRTCLQTKLKTHLSEDKSRIGGPKKPQVITIKTTDAAEKERIIEFLKKLM